MTDKNHSDSSELLKETPITKEQKAVLTQKYLEDSIEKILSGHEFETEEEKNKYREIFFEQFQN